MKLLHLDSSIQGDNSVSRVISAAVVQHLRKANDDLEVVYRDLSEAPLPHLTLSQFTTPATAEIMSEFLSTDIVVISAPMYNFGIPTQLKSWFDNILVSGKTFRYGKNGAEGLAGGKRVVVALARGGFYSEASHVAMEHAEMHLRSMLGFIGIAHPEFIIAEGVATSPEQREKALKAALESADRVEPLMRNTSLQK